MIGGATEQSQSAWRGRFVCTATILGALAALLFLDGQLGPLSFTLRRATALTVLAVLAASRVGRGGWSFQADPSGRFTVANVPHGRYRVQMSQDGGGKAMRSLPFEVGDGQSETMVRWASP